MEICYNWQTKPSLCLSSKVFDDYHVGLEPIISFNLLIIVWINHLVHEPFPMLCSRLYNFVCLRKQTQRYAGLWNIYQEGIRGLSRDAEAVQLDIQDSSQLRRQNKWHTCLNIEDVKDEMQKAQGLEEPP